MGGASRGKEQGQRRGNKRSDRGGEEDEVGNEDDGGDKDDGRTSVQATEQKWKGNNTGKQQRKLESVSQGDRRQGREQRQKHQLKRR